MNCKPGDLAVIVRSLYGNEGKIVRCIRYEDWLWLIEGNINGNKGPNATHIEDAFLRPIRDNDGEDETLTWAGKPQKEIA